MPTPQKNIIYDNGFFRVEIQILPQKKVWMQNPHREERPLAILSVFEKDGEKPFHKKIVSQDDKVTTKGMLWWKRNTVRTAKENLCDATLEMLKLADKYKEQKNIGEEAVNISKRTFQAFKEIDRLLEV